MNDKLNIVAQIARKSKNRIDLWGTVINRLSIEVMAEIGVFRGEYAKAILENCPNIREYIMVDPWKNLDNWNKPANKKQDVFDEIYEEAVSKTAFAKEKIKIFRSTTSDAIDKIPDQSLDIVYIDGDHTLRGITVDLIKIFPKVKHGGIIAGDDFNRNLWTHNQKFEPTMVCPLAIYFAEAMDVPILCLPFNQFLILKDSNIGFKLFDLVGGYTDISVLKMHKAG